MYTGVKEASPRILVVRLGAMGDIVHTLPAVASLKHSFPGSHVTWAIAPQWVPASRRQRVRRPPHPAGADESGRSAALPPGIAARSIPFRRGFSGADQIRPGGLGCRARPHFRIRPLARARKTRGAVLLELRGAFVEARGGSQPGPGARGWGFEPALCVPVAAGRAG